MRVSCLKVVARKVVAKQCLTDPRQEPPTSPLQRGPLLQVLRPAGGEIEPRVAQSARELVLPRQGRGIHKPGVTAGDLRATCLHLCLCWLEFPDLGDRKKWGEESVRKGSGSIRKGEV